MLSRAFVGLWLLVLQLAGVLYFSLGFLLTRPVFEDVAQASDPLVDGSSTLPGVPAFARAVVIIIDALRHDFVVPQENSSAPYHNHLTVMHELAQSQPDQAVLYKFMADPPTTTLQRLKGLTTGSLPTFIDAGSNFAGTEIVEDNWITQLHDAGASIFHVGDDTWTALFEKQFAANRTFPYDSLNVWDLHSVDNGVMHHLFPMLKGDYGHWDLVVAHCLGVDHAGHRYGPSHSAMTDKLVQMDQFIQDVIAELDNDTLLVVMGDHGMDIKGDHGGDTQLELEAALFMYARTPHFHRHENHKAGHGVVQQIDLVPTMSLLLGVPIPYNNLGFPVAEAFDASARALASQLTAAQIHRYRQKFEPEMGEEQVYAEIARAESQAEICQRSRQYQEQTLQACREQWVNFDLARLGLGLGLSVVATVIVAAYFEKLATFDNDEVAGALSVHVGAALAVGLSANFYFREPWHHAAVLSGAAGVILGSIQMVSKWLRQRSRLSHTTVLALVLTVLHTVSLSSNSFTVWEDRCLHFLVMSFGLYTFVRSLGQFRDGPTPMRKTLEGCWHSATFIALSKLASVWTICREEQGSFCTVTFYQSDASSVGSPWALVGLAVCALAMPVLIKSFFRSTANYEGSARLWVGVFMRAVLVLAFVYWGLDAMDTHGWWELRDYGMLTPALASTIKIVVARTVLGSALVALNWAWYSGGGLSIRVDVDQSANGKTQAAIRGYHNMYGSSYLLVVLNVFMAVVIVSKPLGAVVLCLLVYQVLTLLEIVDVLDLRDSWLPSVVLGLLGWTYFFSTGHQATIPSVQWDVAFVPAQTITFPLTHIALVLNTFAPILITTMAAPLVALWKLGPQPVAERLHARASRAVLGLLLYHTIVATGVMVWTTLLRRHLMLWKVFAPRFMIGGLTLLTVSVLSIVALVASRRTIKYIDELGVL